VKILGELRRRNVLRVGAAYIVVAWLVIQVVETIFPIYGISDSAVRVVVTVLAIGLLPVLIFAWVFELTPEGLRKEKDIDRSASVTHRTGKILDQLIIVVLALALVYFAVDKFLLSPTREAASVESAVREARTDVMLRSYGGRSIAVLPFVDMSAGRDQEYMSDGIAEEVLNLLAKIRQLRVISRSSAFSFKGKDIDIPTVAEDLDVSYILEGSVRKAGNQLRITAQLIDARSDTHVWSQTYNRELKNIFEIQDEIAAAVVQELKVSLLGEAPKSQPVNEEAYTLALQARFFWNRRGPGDEANAMEYYRRALAIDENYAPAWAGVSVALAVQALAHEIPREAGLAQAYEAAEKALALDPDLSDAHVRMGQAKLRAGDWSGGAAEFDRALELDPRSPLALGVSAILLKARGRQDESIDLYKKAAAIDPLSAIWPGNMAETMLDAGRLDEAEAAARQSFDLNADTDKYNLFLGKLYIVRGRNEAALEKFLSVPESAHSLLGLAIAYHKTGQFDEANAALEQLKKESREDLAIYYLGMLYSEWGEYDQAFEWLEKFPYNVWNVAFDPYFRNLHDDPRWRPALAKMKSPLQAVETYYPAD
jgi:adenylate cyclase